MKSKPICGARTRKGAPCQSKRLRAGRRCRFHGGKSSGAKTPEGKARAVDAMHGVRHSVAGRAAHSELMRSKWASPEFRLRVALVKAARGNRRDRGYVSAARLNLPELEKRVAWAARRRAVRAARIKALEAAVLNARVARDLRLFLPR
jgi:hypothetical protein